MKSTINLRLDIEHDENIPKAEEIAEMVSETLRDRLIEGQPRYVSVAVHIRSAAIQGHVVLVVEAIHNDDA